MLKTINTIVLRESRSFACATRCYSVHSDTYNSTSPNAPPPPPPAQTKKSNDAPQNKTPTEPLFTEETRERLARLRQHHFHSTNIPDSPDFGTNQYININEELRQQLKDIVSTFNAPVRYAFAYGSGVFQQSGYDNKKKPMLDFIFGVTHPGHWHALNMHQNPHHYSGMRLLGSGAVAMLQEKVGAGVYFNPYVEVNGMIIKYGVVSIDRLCKDLIDWETLYLAGRMHKPVKILRDDARVRLANQVNLTEAVRVALLTLPERFTEAELFEKIAGISYHGDFRMVVGENPNKVKNIVNAQMDHFHRLYYGLLDDLPNVAFLRDGHYQQSQNPKFRGLMVQKLPKTLYDKVLAEHRNYAAKHNLSLPEEKIELYQQISSSPMLSKYIDKSLYDTIARTAMTQSIKGIITAGPVKTTRYAAEKLSKWWSAKK
ncbi:mitochondrial matrix Mmp37-domain-containing protein [Radiomyces spectabilis]|uniref:mitochondrial matrix Mmp37-domain-containing protein n=1 Tax=Radiomyces spectabilis TaxID=64574 RepID=UPI00221EC4D3|nr:mitochondrial matrix Mmp37-domain-containing protein [Radiomyces spectabilis]KAI8370336.1 mitochondrial matrix Mmp37-domain-containing protein [Radiomyces spectabilis]